jgi:uncharacterized LabA/DUF88 family protein
MSRVAAYIDGFNLYHGIDALGRPDLKWLNLRKVCESYMQKQDTLVSVMYFTALMKWNPEKAKRHLAYISALQATGVEVVLSKFQKNKKYCNAFDRYCDFYEEKQTDVAFAVNVMSDAHGGIADRMLLLTADSDQIPLVQQVREKCPTISVEIIAPPGRIKQARELCAVASRCDELSAGRLGTCLFPRNVINDTGHVVARCPADYVPA